MSSQYDLAILGSGPGGHAAALAASRRGLRVAVIDRGPWGGVCLNVGCIPTKAWLAVAHTLRRIRQAQAMGIRVSSVSLDYPAVCQRNERIVTTLRQGLVGLLRRHNVELMAGAARCEDAHTLAVTHEGQTQLVKADRIILATGAQPHPGPWTFDGQRILSYRDLLAAKTLPASLVIIGGGVIGCEFASCMAAFGVAVTLIEQEPHLLPVDDPDAVRVLAQALETRGVTIRTGTGVSQLVASASGVQVTLADGATLNAERCLVAIGIQPNSRELGLESLGIDTARGVAVNAQLLTAQPHIAAIGDCVPAHGLAHWASAEGVLAVRNLCEQSNGTLDRAMVPRCVYTDPEVAQIGLTEAEAPPTARVSRFSFAALGKSVCDEEPDGFVKVIVDPATDRLLGVTIVGAQASSLIHLGVLALHQGLTAKQLARTLTAHPTLPEAVTEACAQIYGEALYSAGVARGPRRSAERV